MKFLRRIFIIVAVACLLAISVFAAEGTITVLHTPNEKPAAEVSFRLYTVDSPMPNAQTAYVHILESNREPVAEGRTDAAGTVAFPGLEDGTYLLTGQSHYVDNRMCELQMSLITLPGENGQSSVSVQPKYKLGDLLGEESFKVLVIWEGNSEERPDSVEVTIWKNDAIYEVVALNGDSNWQYSWNNAEPTDSWAVSAMLPEEYTVTYDREANVFTVRCAQKEETPTEPSGPKLPQTGQLWWPVPVMIFLGMLLILIGWVRRKESRNEN